MVFLMRDILIPTEVLNKILQSDSLLPHELNSKVADTKAVLTAMCLGAGIDYNLAKNLNAFIDNVDPVDQSWCPGGDVKIFLSNKHWKKDTLLNFAKSFATAIIEELDSRFAYLGILDKFQIFYPQNYLGMDKKNIDEYGKDSFFDILK